MTADLLLNVLLLDYTKSESSVYNYAQANVNNEDIVSHIMEYIHASFNSVTLNELCEKFHYTPSYVCKLIKKHTGLTFKEYLTVERLDYVCKQIVLTKKNMKTIIAESGYVTEEYFYRVFKKRFGMSPNQYKKSVLN